MTEFEPNLAVLPPEQRSLWPELTQVPPHFALYGGTAIALRLGHRRSVDYDFFSPQPFVPDDLVRQIPFLAGAERLRSEANTLSVSVWRGAPVALSFFGAIAFGRVGVPARPAGGPWIASLLDLAATKMAVVQQRAEAKDYLDVYEILQSGMSLEDALGAARAIYEAQFNPAITLKALAYFDDGDLPSIPLKIRDYLQGKATRVGPLTQCSRVSRSLTLEEASGER